MMKLKPNCECCDKDLPPDSREVVICTFHHHKLLFLIIQLIK